MRSPLWLVATLAAVTACSDDVVDVDRNALLRDLTTNVMIPTYVQYASTATALSTELTALCASPSTDGLTRARDAWRASRDAWKEADGFQSGPYETLHMHATVDWYPADPAAVEETLASSDPLTADSVAVLGSNRRGMPGLEVVLFDSTRAPDAIVAALHDGAAPSRRCVYLTAISAQIVQSSNDFVTAWQPTGGGYGNTLATAGQGSSITTTREAFDLVINQIVNELEILQVTRLSTPAGSRNGGVAEPARTQSTLSGNSMAEISAGLRGVRALYYGTYETRTGLGIGTLLASRSPSLDRSMRAEFDACDAALRAITLPLERAVLEQRPLVDAAVAELGRLKRLFAVDLASSLGVTISFNLNDGD